MSVEEKSNDQGTSLDEGTLTGRLHQPVDTAILAFTRIAAGLFIFVWASSYTSNVLLGNEWMPLYEILFQKPKFLFKYWGFEWVKLWPGDGIYWHFTAIRLAAICLAVGFLTRIAAAIASLGVAYVLFVEAHIYVNHYYLMSCLAGLMVFLPVGRRWSIDAWLGIERKASFVPTWQFWLLRFQFGIPYVFGSIAKMNSDWLQGQPASVWLHSWADQKPLVAQFLEVPQAPLLFSYGGLFYDMMVVPLLLYRPTRWVGVAASLGFHLTNSYLFTIGVFPWMMMATMVVFFPPDTVPKLFHWLSSKYSDRQLSYEAACDEYAILGKDILTVDRSFAAKSWVRRVGFGIAVAYVVIQLLMPVRPWILDGNPSWSERGHRFAWRMMLRNKTCQTTFRVEATDGSSMFFPVIVIMTGNQASNAEGKPELLRQAAVALKDLAAEAGVKDARVYCLCLVSLNGRRPVPIVDPNADLSVVQRGWLSDEWVLENPVPVPAFGKEWTRNRDEWWMQLSLPEKFKPLQFMKPSQLLKEYQQGAAANQQQARASKSD